MSTHRSLTLLASLAVAVALLAFAAPAAAHGRGSVGISIGGYYPGPYAGGYGYWGPRRYYGGVSIGIGVPGYYPYYGYGAPWVYAPGYVVVPQAVPAEAPPPAEPARRGPPDPIFYPRQGQSPQQIEADRQDCDRWALTQQGAAARADIFQRATLACMEGRGYTVK